MRSPFLNEIKELADLKNLTFAKLHDLAKEIRQKIISTISTTGGHLSSNLGIVELTIALHRSFSSPLDKFIFDTGHQTYTHKLLTGRNKHFDTIRQLKGLSGFPDPQESPHDHFISGHAGTALSLSLGMAKNRDLTKRSEHIIPIIGDASLTCGLTLEALNNIPKNLARFIVILNDNKMSILKNVGNIQQTLDLFNFEELQAHSCLSKISKLLPKNVLNPAAFFEHFNLNYVGPIDGHDIQKLVETLSSLKDLSSPTLVHVLTKKGKGLKQAIANPTLYHGVRAFDIEQGILSNNQSTFPQIFGRTILQMAQKDPSLLVIAAATMDGSSLFELKREFPERCLDVGIAEGHAVTFAGGLAYGGKMKVVVSIYSSFLQRAFDNLFHDVCLQKLPVLFAIDRSGISGPDGSTHHGIYDIGYLNAMPNIVIAQPRSGKVLKELLNSAFSWELPVAIRYPNLATEDEPPQIKREVGSAEILVRGKNLLIIALGHMCEIALKVQEDLKKEGIEATVLDPVFIKPLDSDLLYELISTHPFIVTLEEHSLNGGFSYIFNNFTIRNGFNNLQILNLGIPDTFLQHGSNADLLKELGLDSIQIASKIKQHFSLNQIYKLSDSV